MMQQRTRRTYPSPDGYYHTKIPLRILETGGDTLPYNHDLPTHIPKYYFEDLTWECHVDGKVPDEFVFSPHEGQKRESYSLTIYRHSPTGTITLGASYSFTSFIIPFKKFKSVEELFGAYPDLKRCSGLLHMVCATY